VFRTVPRSVAITIRRSGISRCVRRAFRVVVTGLLIHRVVFSLGTRVILTSANTRVFTTAWHIVVDLSARRVDVYRDGRRLRRFPAIVGKPFTPTPAGEYFVEENVQLGAYQPGGPFALATSDRSNVLQEFDGGPGQIAIHGLDNLTGQLGTAVSHGCIRLADSAITWLAARINPGVPITIT